MPGTVLGLGYIGYTMVPAAMEVRLVYLQQVLSSLQISIFQKGLPLFTHAHSHLLADDSYSHFDKIQLR